MHVFKNSNAAVKQGAFTKDHWEEIYDLEVENNLTLLFNESYVVGKMQLALYNIAKEYNLLVDHDKHSMKWYSM